MKSRRPKAAPRSVRCSVACVWPGIHVSSLGTNLVSRAGGASKSEMTMPGSRRIGWPHPLKDLLDTRCTVVFPREYCVIIGDRATVTVSLWPTRTLKSTQTAPMVTELKAMTSLQSYSTGNKLFYFFFLSEPHGRFRTQSAYLERRVFSGWWLTAADNVKNFVLFYTWTSRHGNFKVPF